MGIVGSSSIHIYCLTEGDTKVWLQDPTERRNGIYRFNMDTRKLSWVRYEDANTSEIGPSGNRAALKKLDDEYDVRLAALECFLGHPRVARTEDGVDDDVTTVILTVHGIKSGSAMTMSAAEDGK